VLSPLRRSSKFRAFLYFVNYECTSEVLPNVMQVYFVNSECTSECYAGTICNNGKYFCFFHICIVLCLKYIIWMICRKVRSFVKNYKDDKDFWRLCHSGPRTGKVKSRISEVLLMTLQASTLTYFSTCPFGHLTKIITCPTQSFSCLKKLIKITKQKLENNYPGLPLLSN
jgi:hypothetical protein